MIFLGAAAVMTCLFLPLIVTIVLEIMLMALLLLLSPQFWAFIFICWLVKRLLF